MDNILRQASSNPESSLTQRKGISSSSRLYSNEMKESRASKDIDSVKTVPVSGLNDFQVEWSLNDNYSRYVLYVDPIFKSFYTPNPEELPTPLKITIKTFVSTSIYTHSMCFRSNIFCPEVKRSRNQTIQRNSHAYTINAILEGMCAFYKRHCFVFVLSGDSQFI